MNYSTILILQAAVNNESVARYTRETAENTAFFPFDFLALLVALGSLVASSFSVYYALRTWHSQRQTEQNTSRLDVIVQKELLVDLCRHLYRNLVVSYAIANKIRPDFKEYPSEEHLMKMKVNMEDIHDELFYKMHESFQQISKLYLNLRNYNTELDIISDHLRNPDIDTKTKERDIKTLLFKCSFLTEQIMMLLAIYRLESEKGEGWMESIKTVRDSDNQSVAEKRRMLMMPEIQQIRKEFDDQLGMKKSPEKTFIVISKDYLGKTTYERLIYTDDFDTYFLTNLNAHVAIEMGNNNQGGVKIHLIACPQ